jgi:formate/nitrite transporter FocA (FNT family)
MTTETASPDQAADHRPGVGSDPASDAAVAEREVEEALRSVIDEGRRRLSRRWPSLIATGAVGGVDVGTGVLGLLLVEMMTGNKLLGGLVFSVGFITLSMARSELFTEDFLIPVSSVLARQARFRMLIRLWLVTLVANLVGGWLFTWFIIKGYPKMAPTALEAGTYYANLHVGLSSFCLAVLGGAVITLMTWMQHGTDAVMGKIVAAVVAGFLLGAGRLNHAIVSSLLMFAGLHTGHAPYGYLQWVQSAGWAAMGNIFGGVGLVTLLRVAQSPHVLMEERRNPALGVPIGDHRRVDG